MTPRERVLAAVNHQETDFVPWQFSIEEEPARRLDDHYGGPQWREWVVNHYYSVGVDWGHVRETGGVWRDKWGTAWRDKNIFHITEPVLPEPTLKGYHLPTVDEMLPEEELVRITELVAGNRDKCTFAGMGLSFWERMWALRGMENAMVDLVENPNFTNDLLDALMELHLQVNGRLLSIPGLDGIYFGDDFGAQRGVIMGLKHWRNYFEPRLVRMYGQVKSAGKYVFIHSCGDNSQIIGDLIEIGVDIFNPLQPEAQDVYEMKRRFGAHITLDGGLGTQALLPHGTPEGIRAEISRLCRQLGQGGGFIIESTKPIMSDVPTPNAVACLEALLEQTGAQTPNR